MNPSHYDAIVIGSGQGGTPLSMALAKAAMRTALIERKHVGGTCINEGCIQTLRHALAPAGQRPPRAPTAPARPSCNAVAGSMSRYARFP